MYVERYLSGVEPVVSVVLTGRGLQGTDDGLGDGFVYTRLVIHVLCRGSEQNCFPGKISDKDTDGQAEHNRLCLRPCGRRPYLGGIGMSHFPKHTFSPAADTKVCSTHTRAHSQIIMTGVS